MVKVKKTSKPAFGKRPKKSKASIQLPIAKQTKAVKKSTSKDKVVVIDTKRRGTVMVEHIPKGFGESEAKEFFKQFGEVTRVNLPRSKKTGNPMGYVFVEFLHYDVAKVAAETMNNFLLDKRLLKARLVEKAYFPKKSNIQVHANPQYVKIAAGKVNKLVQNSRKNFKKKMDKLKNFNYSIEVIDDVEEMCIEDDDDDDDDDGVEDMPTESKVPRVLWLDESDEEISFKIPEKGVIVKYLGSSNRASSKASPNPKTQTAVNSPSSVRQLKKLVQNDSPVIGKSPAKKRNQSPSKDSPPSKKSTSAMKVTSLVKLGTPLKDSPDLNKEQRTSRRSMTASKETPSKKIVTNGKQVTQTTKNLVTTAKISPPSKKSTPQGKTATPAKNSPPAKKSTPHGKTATPAKNSPPAKKSTPQDKIATPAKKILADSPQKSSSKDSPATRSRKSTSNVKKIETPRKAVSSSKSSPLINKQLSPLQQNPNRKSLSVSSSVLIEEYSEIVSIAPSKKSPPRNVASPDAKKFNTPKKVDLPNSLGEKTPKKVGTPTAEQIKTPKKQTPALNKKVTPPKKLSSILKQSAIPVLKKLGSSKKAVSRKSMPSNSPAKKKHRVSFGV